MAGTCAGRSARYGRDSCDSDSMACYTVELKEALRSHERRMSAIPEAIETNSDAFSAESLLPSLHAKLSLPASSERNGIKIARPVRGDSAFEALIRRARGREKKIFLRIRKSLLEEKSIMYILQLENSGSSDIEERRARMDTRAE